MNALEYRRHAATSTLRTLPRAWLLTMSLLGVGIAAPARAQQTASCDLDCPLGTACELILACPAIACGEDNPDCAPCEGPGTPYCAPAACDSDSDCDPSMKCFEFVDSCAADPLLVPAPGQSGGASPSPPCEPSSTKQCIPRWQLACSSDNDCGEGFRCEEFESCGVPGHDPSSGEPPTDEVVCNPTGQFGCVLIETACSTSADCPASFECIDNPSSACSSSSSGETQCTTPDPARLCAPRAVGSPAPSANAVTSSAESTSGSGLDNDAASIETSASEGGCSLVAPSPASPLALLSTIGLGLALATRRRR